MKNKNIYNLSKLYNNGYKTVEITAYDRMNKLNNIYAPNHEYASHVSYLRYESVSYTHLDVYKRQILRSTDVTIPAAIPENISTGK